MLHLQSVPVSKLFLKLSSSGFVPCLAVLTPLLQGMEQLLVFLLYSQAPFF